ncbi:SRPBCC family protein [Mucilaginibacter roseus]|uniref:SRPBCC family protein n=1 Tax=Mucilaginibacter roseus TaxID=1528868 RepID=A0ABS8U0R4_9SPHI|nr:SRPBCC family protein [Mucilaginibacter roseus]MCD8740698.1 SRPBCC family protein [Mucilaginibacter roseus]
MKNTNSDAITVQATINAPVEKVWTYWNAPEHITQWCQASADWHAPYAENDLRPDGKFKTTMAAKDGSVSFDFEGVYTEVEPQKTISYTMADGRMVTIEFEGNDNITTVTETFDPENTNPIEMQRGGWQAILNSFKQYTEEN